MPTTSSSSDALLQIAAHELRHPLHLMRLALLRHFDDPQSEVRRDLDRYIDRMTRVIDDLVDYTRAERRELELEVVPVDLSAIVLDLVDGYQTVAEQHELLLAFEAPPEPLCVMADQHRLAQVFSNLLDNAVKFTPAGGAVSVQLTRKDDHAEVCVSDTGLGITPETLPHVFELFTSNGGNHGLGIGLPVARRIVELHFGEIRVQSDGLDHGTTVVVRLPLLK